MKVQEDHAVRTAAKEAEAKGAKPKPQEVTKDTGPKSKEVFVQKDLTLHGVKHPNVSRAVV